MRYLALAGLRITGFEEAFGDKFRAGGEWSSPGAAANALMKKREQRSYGISFTENAYAESLREAAAVASYARAQSDEKFRQVLLKGNERGMIFVYDPPRKKNLETLEGHVEGGSIVGDNVLGNAYTSLATDFVPAADIVPAEDAVPLEIRRADESDIDVLIDIGRRT